MKCVNGLWHYRGRTYATLREALLAVWAQKEGNRMYTYIVTHWSHGTLTVQAKNSDQAKRIACKYYGLKPSDFWCGMSCFSARRVKEAQT